jgi:hypothetical protein
MDTFRSEIADARERIKEHKDSVEAFHFERREFPTQPRADGHYPRDFQSEVKVRRRGGETARYSGGQGVNWVTAFAMDLHDRRFVAPQIDS